MPFFITRANEWTIVRVFPFWKPGQKVFQIRFDPPDGGVWEIAEVAIVERLADSPPAVPEYDFRVPADVAAWLPFQDISSMALDDGTMVVKADGSGPAILSSPCSFDASDRNVLSFRARIKGAEFAEFWYNPDPYAEFKAATRMPFAVIPDGEFHSYNVPLSQARGYANEMGRIGLGLLDAEPDAELAIDFINIGDRPSGPAEPVIEKFIIGRSVSPPGQDVPIYCVVSNRGGTKARSLFLTLHLPRGATLTGVSYLVRRPVARGSVPPANPEQPFPQGLADVFSLRPFEDFAIQYKVRFPRTETVEPVAVSVELTMDSKVISTASATTIISRSVTPPERAPHRPSVTDDDDWILYDEHITLVFPKNPYGYGVVELWARGPEGWRKMGVLPSLGRVTYTSQDGEQLSRDIYASGPDLIRTGGGIIIPNTNVLRFPVKWTDTDGTNWRADYTFEIGQDKRLAEAGCTLSADKPVEIISFSFPEYLAGDGSFGEDRDLGFFPGLEYLLPGERSSGTDFAAATAADRVAPHPFKITIPLMAVIQDGMATGIMWDPLQKWDGEHPVPAAKFASPNFVSPGANHLMGLFAPSLPDWFNGSERGTADPYELQPGKALALSASLFAVQAEDFDSIFHLWLDTVGGLPEVPPIPYECRCYGPVYQAVMTGYTEVAWDEESRGWHRALADPWGPSYESGTAMQMRWALDNNIPMPAELRQNVEDVLAKAMEGREYAGGAFAYYDGPFQDRVQAWLTRGATSAAKIRPDGSVPFEPDKEHSILGKRGDSSSGHTANSLNQVWNYARISANPELIKVGLRGLEYLDTQIRPEGAQVWELQLHVPDVLASARIIPSYLAAYELLGDKHYLDEAVKWAYRGLPFIYFWQAPDRPIMPYGSIPVFGATWFTGGWFGRIVQWNGIDYADALLELAKYDDSLDWRLIAEGINISAVQQMRPVDHDSYSLKDYIPDCGHTGMYPDAYSAVKGEDAYHWCLSSKRILDLTLNLLGRHPGAKMTIVKAEGDTADLPRASELTAPMAHIGSVAYVDEPYYDSSSLRFEARIRPRGITHRMYIHGIPAPVRVTVDGDELLKLKDLQDGPVGYSWEGGILYLKLVQKADKHQIEVGF